MKEPYITQISEEQLKDISGGATNPNCYFTPAKPLRTQGISPLGVWDKTIKVLCGSDCSGGIGHFCRCHGTDRCIDRFHLMVQFNSINTLTPAPFPEYNHSAADKVVTIPK